MRLIRSSYALMLDPTVPSVTFTSDSFFSVSSSYRSRERVRTALHGGCAHIAETYSICLFCQGEGKGVMACHGMGAGRQTEVSLTPVEHIDSFLSLYLQGQGLAQVNGPEFGTDTHLILLHLVEYAWKIRGFYLFCQLSLGSRMLSVSKACSLTKDTHYTSETIKCYLVIIPYFCIALSNLYVNRFHR